MNCINLQCCCLKCYKRLLFVCFAQLSPSSPARVVNIHVTVEMFIQMFHQEPTVAAMNCINLQCCLKCYKRLLFALEEGDNCLPLLQCVLLTPSTWLPCKRGREDWNCEVNFPPPSPQTWAWRWREFDIRFSWSARLLLTTPRHVTSLNMASPPLPPFPSCTCTSIVL